jgi:predicted HTH domain antitoxin
MRVTLEIPDEALDSLREDPASFASELRLAAAVKWYEMGRLSQGRAAEVAGLSRAEFLQALGNFGVTPFQYGAEEILREAERGG